MEAGKGIVGLFLGAVEAVFTSLTLSCYCLCTSSRLELPLKDLSAFFPDNTQLCLTGDLQPMLVPPPSLHFKEKVQSKKLVYSTAAVADFSAGAGKNEMCFIYKEYIRVKDYMNLSRVQIVINLSHLR